MTELGFSSLLPPLVAIGFAMWTRQVYLSLFLGLLVGYTILAGWNPIVGFGDSLEALLKVFQSESNSAVIIFSVLMGVLINFTQSSGGVQGFVQWLEKRGFVNSKRSAGLMAWAIGMVIFVETNITCLVTGTVCRPVFDKHKISREKLAYIVDSTSSPVCIMIPLNAWGAFIVGLLAEQGIEAPVKLFVQSIPFNFYAILSLILVVGVIITQRDIGPMKDAEIRAIDLADDEDNYRSSTSELGNIEVVKGVTPKAMNMIIPIATMVLMMPVGLYVTGGGDLLNGSGSKSVLLAVITAVFLAAVLYRVQGIMKLPELSSKFIEGSRALMPMAIIMMLAFAIGNLTNEMGTGNYVAKVVGSSVSYILIPPILFLVSSAISFSTGTSWGTFAIMIPIAVPLVIQTGGALPLTIGAVLGGGIFGDHCSPISDTTIISSLASMSDHIEHVKTQLPYALLAGAATTLLLTISAAF